MACWRTKAAISLKRVKIEEKLLWTAYRNSPTTDRRYVPIYATLQIFVKLSSTITKICHIKCDHVACVSTDGAHFEHIMVVALNTA